MTHQTTNDQAREVAHRESLQEQQGSREDKHDVANQAAQQQEASDSSTAQQGSRPANSEERHAQQLDESDGQGGPDGKQGQFGSQAPFAGV